MSTTAAHPHDLLLADPNVDVLVIPITGAVESMSAPMVRDIVAGFFILFENLFLVGDFIECYLVHAEKRTL